MQVLPASCWEAGADRPWPLAKPAVGSMMKYLGRCLSRAEIEATYAELCGAGKADSVGAYLVPVLYGKQLENVTAADVAEGLRTTLLETLPGWDWQVPVTCWIGKYGFCHTCVPAPPADDGQPMALEVFGGVVAIDGDDIRSWPSERRYGRLRDLDDEEMTIQIVSATYANVAWLGYDVPFYL